MGGSNPHIDLESPWRKFPENRISSIKKQHFRGLVGPIGDQGSGHEPKIRPQKGLKHALFGPFWVYTQKID